MKSADPGDRVAKARESFGAVVQGIANRERCGHAVAMSKARIERPDLFSAAYDYEANDCDGSQPESAAKAHQGLMTIARDIAARDGLPLHHAMIKARQSNPALFAAAMR